MTRHFPLLVCLVLLGATSAGCAVRSVYVKPDFDRTDKLNLKRVGVFATPLPRAPAKAAALLARMARRFVHQHKDYLVVADDVLKAAGAWKEKCKGGLHGVVRVMVAAVSLDASELALDMAVDLLRCDTGTLVWKVEIRDTNEQRNEDLSELAGVYEREFGQVAKKYAAPFFIAVKAAFDSLPSPRLTEEETMEKIEME